MSYTTFTVSVSNPGSGNKYYINGALQATVALAKGATYRFDQAGNTNGGHPLKLSTTSNGTHGGGSEYTTGVTYVGTPGQAGAYTQIVVSNSAPATLYYYCQYHSGMGGQANITANSYGALQWSQGNWAAQGDVAISSTGQSLTSSIGTAVVDAIIEEGWGGDTWGENLWGELSGSQPSITGQQLTSTIGSATTISAGADVDVTGILLNTSNGGVVGGSSVLVTVVGSLESMAVGSVQTPIQQNINVSGQQLTSTTNSVTIDDSTLTGIGWGRRTWGNLAWGGAYSAIAVGQELTSTINFPATGAFTDVDVQVTSAGQLNITYASPSFSISIDQDIFVLASEDQLDMTNGGVLGVTGVATVDVTGQQMTSSVGVVDAGLKTEVPVTGIQATMNLGSINLVQSTIEPVTGQQLAMTLGQHAEIPGQIIGVGGLELSSNIGSVEVTGTASIDVTGIQLTASVGSPNITAWAEIDPNVTNVWTEVDLAA